MMDQFGLYGQYGPDGLRNGGQDPWRSMPVHWVHAVHTNRKIQEPLQ